MKKITLVAAFAAVAAVSMSANAWWGGPFDSFGDGWGDANFSMSFGAHGSSWARGYDYNGPYGYAPYGVAPYYGAAAPANAPTAEQIAQAQQDAIAAQQKWIADAVEAQRKFVEQMANNAPVAPATGLAPFEPPFASSYGNEMPKALAERDAEMQKQFAARNEEMQKKIAEHEAEMQKQIASHGEELAKWIAEDQQRMFQPVADNFKPAATPEEMKAQRDEMRAQMESRRAEMLKKVEEQRKQADARQAALRQAAEQRGQDKI